MEARENGSRNQYIWLGDALSTEATDIEKQMRCVIRPPCDLSCVRVLLGYFGMKVNGKCETRHAVEDPG